MARRTSASASASATATPATATAIAPSETEALYREIARLKAEQAALVAAAAKTKAPRAISFKATEKGGLSLYGLGRFPVTLYAQQWVALLNASEAIAEALVKAKASLIWNKEAAVKGQDAPTDAEIRGK